ncbi:hypothetical protein [Streptomyces sp. NPDC050263]|uniref:hypothetical protein n=1 Tax=Streptomyces sp. NPDC050263 TaxID=3155037 RepID=UPI00343334EC
MERGQRPQHERDGEQHLAGLFGPWCDGELVSAVADDLPYSSGHHVPLMVKGLGGTPIGELYLVCLLTPS